MRAPNDANRYVPGGVHGSDLFLCSLRYSAVAEYSKPSRNAGRACFSVKKLLFVTRELPFPAHSVGKTKTLKLLYSLAERYEITLACPLKRDDASNVDGFHAVSPCDQHLYESVDIPRSPYSLAVSYLRGMPLSVHRTTNLALKRRIEALASRYDVIVLDHYEVYAYLPASYDGLCVYHAHDAYVRMWQRYSEFSANMVLRLAANIEARRVRAYELDVARTADITFASPNDVVELVAQSVPADKLHNTFHVGDDSQFEQPDLHFENTQNKLMYVGLLERETKAQGLVWFVEEVWPPLLQLHPDLRFDIVGKNPCERLRHAVAGISGIRLLGFVEDLETVYRGSRVFVAPFLFGRGMKVKVRDAMARGMPIVTTVLGAEGIAIENGKHLLVADTPEEMADYIDTLLTNSAMWRRLQGYSRALIQEFYTWEKLSIAMHLAIENRLQESEKKKSNMSTLPQMLERDCVNFLGIPVDNLSLQQAVDRIVSMARIRDGRARLVSTLKVDFLVKSLGFAFSRPRHPELLEVLRSSEMVTADGFTIVWLSKILGKPLQGRVTGADLVSALAARAPEERISLYLLGGIEGSTATAAKVLAAANPGLTIAGTAVPFVHNRGPQLLDFAEDDETTLESINSSGAEILLVGLGNTKQELWFNRNRHKLRVPVAIGVGGFFERISSSEKRAPQWLQNINLEWVYRMSQVPARLWQRYATGLFKLTIITAPLFYYRAKELLFYRVEEGSDAPDLKWQSVWSSRSQCLSVLRLPRRVTASYLKCLVRLLRKQQTDVVQYLLDFSDVRHVDTAAQQEFFVIGALLSEPGANTSLLGMSASIKRHLSVCRIMDVIGEVERGNILTALASHLPDRSGDGSSITSYVISNTTLIFLAGAVSSHSLAKVGLIECLRHAARDRTCIIDFRNVSLLESTGVVCLQEAAVEVYEKGEGAILISGAGANVRQMFRMTGLDLSIIFIDDNTLLTSIAA
jgi:exopolysaccharide biosynthesis WecB/TagA/CpsF family protein